jgi:hypothetical protein
MDAGANERAREDLHGLVMQPALAAIARSRRAAAPGPLLALAALMLVTGVAGGLFRLGIAPSIAANAEWLGRAALAHAALMIGAFLGTVIGIERAVAVKRRAAWLAPIASALAGACLLLGKAHAGAWLGVAGAALFAAVNVVVVRRQPAVHTGLLWLAAVAWLAGNLLFATGAGSGAVLPWWFAFLVVTIAAERVEMTRLTRRRPAAHPLLFGVLLAMFGGAAASSFAPRLGGLLYGVSLIALACWFGMFDIARRTVASKGLPRYMAVALLGGYAWLAIGGVGWVLSALGLPLRDTALHAVGLGFVFSMMMAHAPVILPAVARIKIRFGIIFYLPLAALHVSLLLRLGGGSFDPALRSTGALLNAASIALFALTLAGAAIGWHIRHDAETVQDILHG